VGVEKAGFEPLELNQSSKKRILAQEKRQDLEKKGGSWKKNNPTKNKNNPNRNKNKNKNKKFYGSPVAMGSTHITHTSHASHLLSSSLSHHPPPSPLS
jgi:hypothetical protein